MSIVTQRQYAPIIAPIFIDNEANRIDLVEKFNSALKNHAHTGRDMSKRVLSEVYQSTGADWLVLRDFIKLNRDKVNLSPFENWFNTNRIFTNLARHLRRELNEFTAFSNLFSEFSITLESLYQLTAGAKTLDRFGLNRSDLLKQINFVSNATTENFEMAIPAMFGFLEILSNYKISARELDRIDDTLVILDTLNDDFVQHFGFEFNDFYANLYIENQLNDALAVEIDSTHLAMSGIAFDVDDGDGSAVLQQPVFATLQSLWCAALRCDAPAMFELTRERTTRSHERNSLIGVAHAN
jgi:hypothetical protein